MFQVESCRALNDANRPKAWSKYSKEALEAAKAKLKKAAAEKKLEEKKASDKLSQAEKKAKKLERLVGDLKDDVEFQEFLAANKAISSKDSIWKNDFGVADLDLNTDEPSPSDNKALKKKKNKKAAAKSEEDEDEDEDDVSPKEEKKDKNGDKPKSDAKDPQQQQQQQDEKEIDFENGRLFVRNLSYECKEEDLEKLFSAYGPLVECIMPLDNFSKKPKGFAYITCMFPEKALKAHNDLDGSIFQGRMLHILPAQTKKEMDEEEELKLGFKQKKVSIHYLSKTKFKNKWYLN